jgi:hypothetical protein
METNTAPALDEFYHQWRKELGLKSERINIAESTQSDTDNKHKLKRHLFRNRLATFRRLASTLKGQCGAESLIIIKHNGRHHILNSTSTVRSGCLADILQLLEREIVPAE